MNKKKKIFICSVIAGCFLLLLSCARLREPELEVKKKEYLYDLVIKNGYLIDGTGNPWFRADVGIRGKKIAKIGYIEKEKARQVIDARSLFVVPGFIDIHTHCERGLLVRPGVENYIYQGVTTVIGGNCGDHPFPLKEYFQKLTEQECSVNFGCLIGHNTVRRKVMGLRMSKPTRDEMERMKSLIDMEMSAGALGLSTGLAYMPGVYSKTEELVELASVVAKYGGVYASHIRDQGRHTTEAIEEAIKIGEKNGIPVQISHIKLADDAVWGEIERIAAPVLRARKRGVEITLDQYPYTATSSGFSSSFPSWSLEGGGREFVKRLRNPGNYSKIKREIIKKRLTSTKNINKLKTIYIARYQKNHKYEGKNLEEILKMQGRAPTIENAADLIIEIEKKGGAQGIFFQMNEGDVKTLMRLPYNMIASDGGVQFYGSGVPHPRNYGTFPRVIGRYVRQKRILQLEDAIRKMTSLPAQTLRLKDRGMIREGMYADINIFDYDKILDKATYKNPHQYPEGIIYVIVNGEIIIERGRYNGQLPGMIIYGPGKK
ncbi:MAG: amidohydrolase family protein [Candidatus Aminicenantia bacterium]